MARDRSSVVEVADLRRRLGERRAIDLVVGHEPFAVGTSHVDADDPVAVSLSLESISAGISATGRVEVRWHGSCRRCLDDIEGQLVAEVSEIFADVPVEGETYPIGHDQIDVAELVRDAVLMALPTAPLCREDCSGPIPDRFPVTVAEDDTGDSDRPIDPRWAALDVLREPPES